MTNQSLRDKEYQYFGSDRAYYSGIGDVGSATAWTFVNFSGTFTGFGTASNERNQRFAIVSSGTSYMEWSYNNGSSQAGEVWDGLSSTQDGINVSGVWLRTNATGQKVQVWAW